MMKARFLFPLVLLGLGLSSRAQAGEVGVGVSGGAVWTDQLEVLGDGWTAIPNISYWFNPTLGAELQVGIIGGKTQIIRGPEAFSYMALTPRVNMIGRLFPDKGVQPLLTLGVGAMTKKVDDATRTDGVDCGDDGCLDLPTGTNMDLDPMVNAGPGVMIPLGDPESSVVNLRADVHWLLTMGSENYQNHGDTFIDWETTAGLYLRFGGSKDSDKDGFNDEDEQCPDQAEDLDQFEDDDGCPEADNDKDGALDALDKCINEAEDRDGFEDADGCPEADNDKDGVLDAADTCPEVAGVAAFAGCPDTDGDGLQDSEDECVSEAGDVKANGCPDKDGDLVPDKRDACPDQKANEGIDPEKSDGCPSRVFVADKAIKITETVQFDTGKATIKKESFGLLDDIVRVLQKFPGIKQVQVEGHTDNVGDDAKNMKLSQERADSVVKYLVDHGVAADRLVAKGFGETDPLADNKTKEGQAANRRVEFEILAQDVSDRAKKRMNGMPGTEDKKEEPKKEEAAPSNMPATPELQKKEEPNNKAPEAPPLEKKE